MRRRGRILVAAILAVAAPPCVAADKQPAAEELAEVRCHHVLVRDGVSYVAQTGGLAIRDLSDPLKHRPLGELRLQSTIHHVALEGDTAYLSAGSHGIFIADVGDPAEPALLQRFDPHGKVMQVVPAGDGVHLFFAAKRHGFGVVELSERVGPARVASVSTSAAVASLDLQGRLLATAEGLAGVRLFDVARPDLPRELAFLREAEGARDVAFADDLLFVAAGRRGVLVYSIEEPGRPKLVSTIPAERSAHSVTRFGRLALVSNGGAGLQVVDPGIEGEPRSLATVRLRSSYPVGRTTVSDKLAYVAADRWGFGIVDLEKPHEPQVLFPRARAMQVRFR